MRGGGGGGGVAQRLDNWMRSKISSCISSCRVVRGGSPGEILKTKNAGEAISGYFAMRLKFQIYLNYAYLQIFHRRKSPFIPCFLNVLEAGRTSSVGCAYRLVSRRSQVRSSRPAHSFVEICMVMKKDLRPLSPFRWFKKGSCQLLAKECALGPGKLPGSFFFFIVFFYSEKSEINDWFRLIF